MLARRCLSKREREVLVVLANGLTYEEAAAVLGIAYGTFKCHSRNLRKKLRAGTTPDAVLKFMKLTDGEGC